MCSLPEKSRILAASESTDAPAPDSPQADLGNLVSRTIRGEFGDHLERRVKLKSNFGRVQEAINKISSSAPVVTPVGGIPVDLIADRVRRGDFGAHADRVKQLGDNFPTVQAFINVQEHHKALPELVDAEKFRQHIASKNSVFVENVDSLKRVLGRELYKELYKR